MNSSVIADYNGGHGGFSMRRQFCTMLVSQNPFSLTSKILICNHLNCLLVQLSPTSLAQIFRQTYSDFLPVFIGYFELETITPVTSNTKLVFCFACSVFVQLTLNFLFSCLQLSLSLNFRRYHQNTAIQV